MGLPTNFPPPPVDCPSVGNSQGKEEERCLEIKMLF